MGKGSNYKGPWHGKVCAQCDGRETRSFKAFWRMIRRMGRAPKINDW